MNDRPKNSPINIPIKFVEDTPSTEPGDDAIEIDGDALEMTDDANETIEADDAASAPVALEPPADVADDESETLTEGVIEEDEPEIREVEEVVEEELDDELDGDEPVAASPSVAAEGAQASTARPELSIDAFKQLTQELRQKTELGDRLAAEKTDLFDRLLRKQAEFENFRKRTEREMQETYRRARADVLLDILPALDNLERALKHSENADATVLHEGLALIYKQLSDTLGRHGLEAIDSVGKPFDPELHEAVAAEPNEEVEDHTVLDELQRGYKLGDRLLRPARVKVSVQS